jgi:hypothetical protein
MKSLRGFLQRLQFFFLAAALTGCATQQAAAPVDASAQPAFEPFHDIVNMAFVKQHVSIPMADTSC